MKKILSASLLVVILTMVWSVNVKAADQINQFSIEKGTKTVMGKVFEIGRAHV